MPTLHVRNVPESIYDRLRPRAQARNRSISAEVVMLHGRQPAGQQAEWQRRYRPQFE